MQINQRLFLSVYLFPIGGSLTISVNVVLFESDCKGRRIGANNEKLICNSFILDITLKCYVFMNYMFKAVN